MTARTIARLDLDDARTTTDVLALYRTIFPDWEREPTSSFLRRHRAGDYVTHLMIDQTHVDAFMTVQRIPAYQLCILAYIAVRPERQGQGIGGRLLTQLLTTYHRDGSTPWLFIEAETPQPCDFYLKHGVARIETPYAAPSYSDATAVHPMALLVAHPDLGSQITGQVLQPMVRELLRDGYPLTEADPRWAQCFGWDRPVHHVSRSLP